MFVALMHMKRKEDASCIHICSFNVQVSYTLYWWMIIWWFWIFSLEDFFPVCYDRHMRGLVVALKYANLHECRLICFFPVLEAVQNTEATQPLLHVLLLWIRHHTHAWWFCSDVIWLAGKQPFSSKKQSLVSAPHVRWFDAFVTYHWKLIILGFWIGGRTKQDIWSIRREVVPGNFREFLMFKWFNQDNPQWQPCVFVSFSTVCSEFNQPNMFVSIPLFTCCRFGCTHKLIWSDQLDGAG